MKQKLFLKVSGMLVLLYGLHPSRRLALSSNVIYIIEIDSMKQKLFLKVSGVLVLLYGLHTSHRVALSSKPI